MAGVGGAPGAGTVEVALDASRRVSTRFSITLPLDKESP